MKRFRLSIGVVLAVLSVGCGSQVIPMAVVEGTSATITLPSGLDLGFGRAWSGQHDFSPTDPADAPAVDLNQLVHEDFQRGETILTLVDGSTVLHRLPVKFITRAKIDPATWEANFDLPIDDQQVVIVFDLPPKLVDDPIPGSSSGKRDLGIRVQRYRRNSEGLFESEPLAATGGGFPSTYWAVGWGRSEGLQITQTIPITVVDDPTALDDDEAANTLVEYNDREGWGLWEDCVVNNCWFKTSSSSTFETRVHDYVPNPEIVLRKSSASPYSTPAAWDFSVTYPSDRMSIVGVSLIRKKPAEAYLDWSTSDPVATCGSSSTGTLHISIADPDILTEGVKIAFKLENISDTDCRTPIVEADVNVDEPNALAFQFNGSSMSFPTLEKSL